MTWNGKELRLCKRCGWSWLPRMEGKPKRCPRCRSVYWDMERGTGADGVPHETGSTVGGEPPQAVRVAKSQTSDAKASERASAETQARPIPTRPAHAPTCKCGTCMAEKERK